MTYRWLTDLDQALAAAGVPFQEVGPSDLDPTGAASWRDRGRPADSFEFDPAGVLCHHTASPAGTSDQAELNTLLYGNGSAPGPIAQLFIGREYQGVYLVAAGRANHGGSGRRPGVDTGGDCADMNALLVGVEVSNNGVGEYWPDPQTQVYARLVAALCDWYGWDIGSQVWLHATTGPPAEGCNSKIDPAGPWYREPELVGSQTWHLDTWRRWCANFAGGVPAPIPPKPPNEGTALVKCIMHVDETQPAGSPGYYAFNAVWVSSLTWRRHLPSELAVRQAVYECTGDAAVWSAGGLGEITRNPEWVQPVGSLEGYGAVAGPDPGDI